MNRSYRIGLACLLTFVACVSTAASQESQLPMQADAVPSKPVHADYQLGPGDRILIHAPDTEELNEKQFSVENDGRITLPLAGSVKASGLTAPQLQDDLTERLKAYIRNPVLNITVVQPRTSPVFFVGDFVHPGVYALQGQRTLVEMLMSAGGLKPTAARRIKVTRREDEGPIPLSGAVYDPNTKTTAVEISLAALSQNVKAADDIVLRPNDAISAEKLEPVYVQGAVARNGGFDIGDKDSISLLQLISIAGGLSADAVPEHAVILRPVVNSNRRTEIPIDLKRVLHAQAIDCPLLPNDVLYVPRRKQMQLAGRLGVMATAIIPSVIVYSLLH